MRETPTVVLTKGFCSTRVALADVVARVREYFAGLPIEVTVEGETATVSRPGLTFRVERVAKLRPFVAEASALRGERAQTRAKQHACALRSRALTVLSLSCLLACDRDAARRERARVEEEQARREAARGAMSAAAGHDRALPLPPPLVGVPRIRRSCTFGGMTMPAEGARQSAEQVLETDGRTHQREAYFRRPERTQDAQPAAELVARVRALATALWNEPEAPQRSAHDRAGCVLELSASGVVRSWNSYDGEAPPSVRAVEAALTSLFNAP